MGRPGVWDFSGISEIWEFGDFGGFWVERGLLADMGFGKIWNFGDFGNL